MAILQMMLILLLFQRSMCAPQGLELSCERSR